MIFDVDDFTLYHRLGRNEIHDEEIRAKYYMKAYYRYSGEFFANDRKCGKVIDY